MEEKNLFWEIDNDELTNFGIFTIVLLGLMVLSEMWQLYVATILDIKRGCKK